MNSIGVNGASSVQKAASGRAGAGIRSPNARLPTWSWSWEKTTNRSGGHVVGRGAEAAAAKARVDAVVHVRAVERLGQIGHATELGVVAVALVGDQRAQRVVEVVGPGGVAPVAADARAAASPADR